MLSDITFLTQNTLFRNNPVIKTREKEIIIHYCQNILFALCVYIKTALMLIAKRPL